ncbi:MAG: hypothetical protein M0R28_01430 [Pigmentiphaga sp.]|nr:hypothetical protein [Pigmentiphaga sp.]
MSETPQQYWQRHVAAQRESGLNIKAYARRENLSVNMLYQWRAQLGQTRRHGSSKALQARSSGFAQAIAVAEPTVADGRESTENPAASSPCRLVLGPGIHLEMDELPSPQWLLRLVSACREAR